MLSLLRLFHHLIKRYFYSEHLKRFNCKTKRLIMDSFQGGASLIEPFIFKYNYIILHVSSIAKTFIRNLNQSYVKRIKTETSK